MDSNLSTAARLDLLIVGAGPVGLATALSALHRGAQRVLVADQARSLRQAGSIIDLLPNAYRVLCSLAPGIREGLQPFVRTPTPGKTRARTTSASGTPIDTAETQSYGTTASLFWWQLQRVLLDALPDPSVVLLNHQLVDIVQDDLSGVAVAEFVVNRQRENRFKNWDGDDDDGLDQVPEECEKRVRFRAKLVVGADGINSVARRCVYRDTNPNWERFADAVYSGFVKVVASGDPALPPAEEAALTELYLQNAEIGRITCDEECVAFDSTRVMIVRARNNKLRVPFSWYVGYSVALDEQTFKSATVEDLCRIVLDKARTAGYSEKLVEMSAMIWAAQENEAIMKRAYYIIPATHPPPYQALRSGGEDGMDYPEDFKRMWHFGRVVLAGDAVHACPPFVAQGSAMGFEDVFELVTRLTDRDVWRCGDGEMDKNVLEQVFEEYRMARLDRVCFVQERVMNRVSEYDVEKSLETMDKLWTFDPLHKI